MQPGNQPNQQPAPLNIGGNQQFPGLNPQEVVTYNYEQEAQRLIDEADFIAPELSGRVAAAARRFARASNALEVNAGGDNQTQDDNDALVAARGNLARSVVAQANAQGIDDPGDRLRLGIAALREADRAQVEARPEGNGFTRWWRRMGQGGVGRRFVRNMTVTGLPAFLVAAGVATFITGGAALPWVVAFGAAKGMAIGAFGGRARAALDRYAENTRDVTEERLDARMGQTALGMVQQVHEAAQLQQQNGQQILPAQMDAIWTNGMDAKVAQSSARRDRNNQLRTAATRQGLIYGGIFGAGGALVGDLLHDAVYGDNTPEAGRGNHNGNGDGTDTGRSGDIRDWMNRNHAAWAENADRMAADHNGGRWLWNDVQRGGDEILTDRETLRTIIPGMNELQAHGAYIDPGGSMHLDNGEWTPGKGKWWLDRVTMPRGGLYALDGDGNPPYLFHGTLDNEHQAALLDLLRDDDVQIFNRRELFEYAEHHHVPGFSGDIDPGQGGDNSGAPAPNGRGPESPLTSGYYLENTAAVERLVADYREQFGLVSPSGMTDQQMLQNFVQANAPTIRQLPVNFQDQLVAGLAEQADVSQAAVRRALEEVMVEANTR